jgi:hypothetical protein
MQPIEMTPLQKNFTEKLAYQMKKHGKGPAEVAAFFGIKQPSVDGWRNTGRIGKDKFPGLADLFGTSLEYWMLEKEPDSEDGRVAVWDKPEDLPPDESRVWVDRWDYNCSAGDGSIQWEIRQKDALPFTLAFFNAIGSKPDHCRLLMVRGSSMEPFLFDKDMIMIDIDKTALRDGKVYAVCFEQEALVKQVFKEAGGALVLHSYNANYPDKLVDPQRVGQFEVIGELVYRSGSGFTDA